MKKGFDRLRGVATAGAVGISSLALNLAGVGSARAAATTLPLVSLTRGSAKWQQIKNTSRLVVNSSSSAVATNSGIFISSAQSGLAINDAALTTGLDNAVDSALFLSVGNHVFKNPDTTADLTSDTLQSDTVTAFEPGLNVSIEYYFHPTRPLVRALYSFTNTTGLNKTIDNILIGGNLGSDGATTLQASSDGDSLLQNSDLWFVTNNKASNTDPDPDVDSDTPVITISRYGNGAASIPVNGFTPGNGIDNFANRYSITVPANSTARILIFAELNKTISEARTCALDFETLDAASSAGLLTGLTIQLNEIVNYATATGTTTSSSCTHNSSNTATPAPDPGTGSATDEDLSTGMLSSKELALILGLISLSRIRRKKQAE